MTKMNYYILVTVDGKRIPVKTKLTIKSLVIANCFCDEIIKSFYTVDFIKYLMMENWDEHDKSYQARKRA